MIARRLVAEGRARADRYLAPRRGRSFDERALLARLGADELDALCDRLARRPFPAVTTPEGARACADALEGERERILAAAEPAVARVVDVLGTGPTQLGTPIDWLTDVKTGRRWPPAYAFDIEYAELDRPSDVKVPWEISRVQWLLPVGQAYLLTGDERYAQAVRDVLEDWIAANPYAGTVNWACAMEPALRILSWTWLFHACAGSAAWRDRSFRSSFLRALYLHLDFVARNLEFSDVNGNHYSADAAGLAVGGLFFGSGAALEHHERGWEILVEELPRQVFPDGVDFEASVPYHRLVAELFLLPALHRAACGLEVPAEYRDRLAGMAAFAATYTRLDGSSPLWGDADDARALPLGTQSLHDHRYLAWIVGRAFGLPDLAAMAGGAPSEALWTLGAERVRAAAPVREPASAVFPQGGVAVLRRGGDHLFVDCGPVGLAGRGGHGHNDALSFEAALEGRLLLTDCGSYVYTASPEWRDAFRATRSHNTPVVDDEEQNRFVRPDWLWSLRDDARAELLEFRVDGALGLFRGRHHGYERLDDPVGVERAIVIDFERHILVVEDILSGRGAHSVRIPYHLGPGIEAREEAPDRWRLRAHGGEYILTAPDGWRVDSRAWWRSPSYGVKEPITTLELRADGPLRPARVTIAPDGVVVEAARLLDRGLR